MWSAIVAFPGHTRLFFFSLFARHTHCERGVGSPSIIADLVQEYGMSWFGVNVVFGVICCV